VLYGTLTELSDSFTAFDLARMRGYIKGSEQEQMLADLNIFRCEADLGWILENCSLTQGDLAEIGSLNKSGKFLLTGRYIIPVYDLQGNLVTLIGYFKDIKKYITLPTLFFSKEIMFFNIESAFKLSFEEFGGTVFLVEGIFDCLSLRALGLPAIATMGAVVGDAKKLLLEQFNKVVYIPDNDITGRKGLDLQRGWKVPKNAVGVKLSGSLDFNEMAENEEGYDKEKIIKIKDVDDLIKFCDGEDIRNIMLEFAKSTERIEKFEIG
jgi:DNA primase